MSTKYCYCPITSIFRKYNIDFQLGKLFGRECAHTCTQNYRMTPRELMHHLQAHSPTSFYHEIIYRFMTNLYTEHWTNGIKHEALYDTSTVMLSKSYQFEKDSRGFHIDNIHKALSNDKLEKLEPDIDPDDRLIPIVFLSVGNKEQVQDIPPSTNSQSIEYNIPESINENPDCFTTLDNETIPPHETNAQTQSPTTTTQPKPSSNAGYTGHVVHPTRLKHVQRLNLICHQDKPVEELDRKKPPSTLPSYTDSNTTKKRYSNPSYHQNQFKRSVPYNIPAKSKTKLGDRWEKPPPTPNEKAKEPPIHKDKDKPPPKPTDKDNPPPTDKDNPPPPQQHKPNPKTNIRREESTTEWTHQSSDESVRMEHERKKSSTVIQLNHTTTQQSSSGHTTTFDLTTTTNDTTEENTPSDMHIDIPTTVQNDQVDDNIPSDMQIDGPTNLNTTNSTIATSNTTTASLNQCKDIQMSSTEQTTQKPVRLKRKLTRKVREAKRKKKKENNRSVKEKRTS